MRCSPQAVFDYRPISIRYSKRNVRGARFDSVESFFFFPPLFFPSLSLSPGMSSVPGRGHFFSYLFFFFPSFPLFFCPTLISSSPFPLPSFLFSFSYSFPITFLHPHSFSSSIFSVLFSFFLSFFFPYLLLFCSLFPPFIILLIAFSFSPPLSFPCLFCFSSRPSIIFPFFHLFAKGV